MHSLGIEGVDFVVCNTDSQALALSPVSNKIQLGPHLTSGLGAGANPEIGKQSCEESLEDITKILKVNTRMAFITCGMGGGTGTGGGPVLAKICRDLGILTVGIVTTPFTYEGRKRMKQAQEGIERMREHVDTILIISNDKLRQQFGNLPFTKAFAKADDILSTAAKCITDVITSTGQINVDFADVCTVMKNGGVAILGSASADGENRALIAVEEALNSPLLNDSDIRGAKWLLLNITSAAGEFEHTMDEAEAIQAYVQQQAGDNCDVILGMGHDPSLKDRIAVTVIATGFNHHDINVDYPARNREPERIVTPLGEGSAAPSFVPAAPQTTSFPQITITEPESVAPVYTPQVTETPTNQEVQGTINFEIKNMEHYLQLVDEPSAQPSSSYDVEEKKEEPQTIQLVIRNEEEAGAEPMRVGGRMLSEEEMEERQRFEEQKRALEERAERLRRMSFNIKGNEGGDDIENVPAYLRKNMKLDNQVASTDDNFYSGYSVGVNGQQNNGQAGIQTINTFLDGKKPD
jgi:cell division protein FtsZ